MAQFVAQVLFVLSGLPAALTQISDTRLRFGLMILSAVLLSLLCAVLFLAWSRAAWRTAYLLCRRPVSPVAWAARDCSSEAKCSLHCGRARRLRPVRVLAYIGWFWGRNLPDPAYAEVAP
jgi:hypothetical protein